MMTPLEMRDEAVRIARDAADFVRIGEPIQFIPARQFAADLALDIADNIRRIRTDGPAWQRIETAPKDGTKFDAWQHGHRVTDVYWSDIQEGWCVDGSYGPEEPTPLAVIPAVLHWMPPPEPPPETEQ